MNWISRYGLEYNPFIKNSKEIIVETSDYKELVHRLNQLVLIKGFGVVTGTPGAGKTTTLRAWSKELNQAAYKVIYISLSTVTVLEFYRQLASELGMEPHNKKTKNFEAIQIAIRRYIVEKRMIPIIILDEANYMRADILNDLKMIFNFDMDSSDKAVILLVGLPQLNGVLNRIANEPLKQRIIMNYHMEGLSKEEAREYISNKLKKAGSEQIIFDSNALETIINASNGICRMIDKLCFKSLEVGNFCNQNIIDSESVINAIDSIGLGE